MYLVLGSTLWRVFECSALPSGTPLHRAACCPAQLCSPGGEAQRRPGKGDWIQNHVELLQLQPRSALLEFSHSSDGNRAWRFLGVRKHDPGSLQVGLVLLKRGTVQVLVGSIFHHVGLSLPAINPTPL